MFSLGRCQGDIIMFRPGALQIPSTCYNTKQNPRSVLFLYGVQKNR